VGKIKLRTRTACGAPEDQADAGAGEETGEKRGKRRGYMRWFLSFLVFQSLVCSSVFECVLSDSGQQESPGGSIQAQFLFHSADGAVEAGFGLPRSIPDSLQSSRWSDEVNRFQIWFGSGEGDLWKDPSDQAMDGSPSPVPIPGTLPLLGTGLAALVIARKRLSGRLLPSFPL